MSNASLPPALLEQASSMYRSLGNFAWHFARGKLRGDPVYAGLLQHGLIPSNARVLDIGCGRGLLAALLCSLDAHAPARAGWPSGWAPAPTGVRVRGIDLMPRDVALAQAALSQSPDRAEFAQGDIRMTQFAQADVAVILDVLHYVDFAAQADVLRRVKAALAPGGRLLLRVGDAAGGWRFRWSQWVDFIVTFLRGLYLPRLYCRPLNEWGRMLSDLGFSVETLPMHHGTPFANSLLVARLPEPAAATTP